MDYPSKLSLRTGLLGLGATALSTAFKLGRRAYQQSINDPPFPTTTMPVKMSRPLKVAGRRRNYPRTFGRRRNTPLYRQYRRSATATTFLSTTTISGGYILSPTLGGVPTADISSAYRMFRIRKCVFTMYPRVDPANSGLVNNFQYTAYMANNPEGPVAAPTSINDMSIYDNCASKPLVSGQVFTYTFYPKVTNSVQGASTAVSAGSYATNPWLKFDAAGLAVPHQQLLVFVQQGGTPGSTTINFEGYVTIYFDVKN